MTDAGLTKMPTTELSSLVLAATIETVGDFNFVTELETELRARVKSIEAEYKDEYDLKYGAYKECLNRKKEALGEAPEAVKAFKKKRIAFDLEQKRLALESAEAKGTMPQATDTDVKGARMKLKWRVVDALVIPRDNLSVNSEQIDELLKVLGDKLNIPGIEVYPFYY